MVKSCNFQTWSESIFPPAGGKVSSPQVQNFSTLLESMCSQHWARDTPPRLLAKSWQPRGVLFYATAAEGDDRRLVTGGDQYLGSAGRFTKTGQMKCNDERVCNDYMQLAHIHAHAYTMRIQAVKQAYCSIHKKLLKPIITWQPCARKHARTCVSKCLKCRICVFLLDSCGTRRGKKNTKGLIFLGDFSIFLQSLCWRTGVAAKCMGQAVPPKPWELDADKALVGPTARVKRWLFAK